MKLENKSKLIIKFLVDRFIPFWASTPVFSKKSVKNKINNYSTGETGTQRR